MDNIDQYILFDLGKTTYGLGIGNVMEISTYTTPTSLPNLPAYAKGVINYRGSIIPTVSLGELLNVEDDDITEHTRIIVISKDGGDDVGLIVNHVSRIERIASGQIDFSADLGTRDEQTGIKGIAKLDSDDLAVILNVEDILKWKSAEQWRFRE